MLVHYSEIIEILLFCFIAGIISGLVARHKFVRWKNSLFKEEEKIDAS